MTNCRMLAFAILALAGFAATEASAACPGSRLTNGQTANADEVMDWLDCKAPTNNPTFSGNVGIGISAPVTRLDVNGGLRLNQANGGNAAAALVELGDRQAGWSYGISWNLFYDGTWRYRSTDYGALLGLGDGTNQGDLIFVTAAGGSAGSGASLSERVRITNAGNVGIGTSSPAQRLVVAGDTANYGISSVVPSGYGAFNTYIGSQGSGKSWSIYPVASGSEADVGFYYGGSSAGTRLTITSGGSVGIGTISPAQKLDVSGTIRQSGCTTAGQIQVNASGDIECYTSDARLKSIYGKYLGGLREIARLSPTRFRYKPTQANPAGGTERAGFIAQNVKDAIPQAVALQRNGYYALDTTAILAASVNAIKELKERNDQQASRLRDLADVVEDLRAEIATLKRSRVARLQGSP